MTTSTLRALPLLLPLAACAPASVTQPAPGVTATTTAADPVPRHDTLTIGSAALGEARLINVHTPAGYAANPSAAFPVLYMPDGGLDEDFPHVVNTIDSLIALKRIAPVIVVGIPNTERRRDLTGPTTVAKDSTIAPRVGGSAAFRRFIRDELMPEVRRRYRTNDEAAIVGESLAGLFIVEAFLLEPALFNRYIAMDPSLWWNGGELVRSAEGRLGALAGAARTLYLTAGKEPSISEGSAALATMLRAARVPGLTFHYEPRPHLDHATIFRATLPPAFATALWHDDDRPQE
jgi:predicted alpha/beta superfamily hydrolase